MPSNPGIKVLISDSPTRSIALATSKHALVLKSNPTTAHAHDRNGYESRNHSNTSLAGPNSNSSSPKCIAEFGAARDFDFDTWRQLGFKEVYGTLGLITVNGDVFLCVVDSATKAAEIRPGETVQKINSVEFHCLTSSRYDHLLNDAVNQWPTDDIDEAGYDLGHPNSDTQPQHPCLQIKKLFSSGTFYYSADFDLTRRLQKRATDEEMTIAIESLDAGFLWNSYMIQPLVDFRARLSRTDKNALDGSRILTSAIRGFCTTITVPWVAAPFRNGRSGMASALSIISRLSCRRAGTRFNARGIDDDGNVANFVESETVFWSPSGICFSYVQIRGSLPVFWEQATGLIPAQQKITISRSPEATQPAFDKHFDQLERSYGAVHIVNLLSTEKPQEAQLSHLYRDHVAHSPLNESDKKGAESEHRLLRLSEYDFHAETRVIGYEAAKGIRYYIMDSADGFVFFLSEERDVSDNANMNKWKTLPILQQEGVFRTNCLDCLDRTNVVQGFISQMALESFFTQQREPALPDFWMRHQTLWADNGDQLSKIYAGTGALKSSFTRHGKMSLGGFLSDVRKSTARIYMNNFQDKDRQNTIDLLLGRLVSQQPVKLYDPIHEWVQGEVRQRMPEFTSTKDINILVATFNVNGKDRGIREDLSPWLCPRVAESQSNPEIVVVAFQEIVELSPQQIMSTDPYRRQYWEEAVKATLNDNAARRAEEEYVMLRGAQLVGASLSVFVRKSSLPYIKNVEGSIKKTGMSGMAGNKGAVAMRMDYASTSLCFVTAHLAAGFANYDERNRDYRIITQGLRFQRDRSIDDHENVIWLGDFNYRIGLSNDKTRQLIADGDLETLYRNDQLNIQMTHGNVFSFYEEARITFKPTYKFNNGTDEYDTSEKARVPAWTDRVLKKGHNLKQINYNSAELRLSDHRPVYATFICTIQVVDEKVKDQITANLFSLRRRVSGDQHLSTTSGYVEEDGLISGLDQSDKSRGYPTDSTLPPPSSNRKKWFIENGASARSTVQLLGPNFALNGSRPSNPFAPSDEPDWVKVDRDKVPAPPPPRRSGNTSHGQGNLLSNEAYEVVSRNNTPPKALPMNRRTLAPPPAQSFVTRNHKPELPNQTGQGAAELEQSSSPRLPPRSQISQISQTTLPPNARRVLPAPILKTSEHDGNALSRSTTVPSSPAESKRPGPPVRPKKPSSLSSTAISPIMTSRPSSIASSNPPDLPLPRRSQAQPAEKAPQIPLASKPSLPARKPSLASSSVPKAAAGAEEPSLQLPPRKLNMDSSAVMVERHETGNLMDDGDGDGEEGLKGYVVLRPMR